jgi:hypothetical protein
MTLIEKIKPLFVAGELDALIQIGVVNRNLTRWCEIFEFYENDLVKTKSKMQSMENTSIEFDISEGMVRHIRRKLSTTINNK